MLASGTGLLLTRGALRLAAILRSEVPNSGWGLVCELEMEPNRGAANPCLHHNNVGRSFQE